MGGADDRALERILPRIGGSETVARLAALNGSDFTSVMLEVMRQRAARETPTDVLRRYRHDRFVQPSQLPSLSLRRAEDALLGCLGEDVEVVILAPLVPLGTHSALGPVSQDKVITAVRACEVAADPTNALALEAAARRPRAGRATVRLAAVQRVVRAQRFGPGSYSHFGLLGLVTAGRDEGGGRFERAALAEQLRFAVRGLAAAAASPAQIALTPLSETGERIALAVTGDLTPAEVVTDYERQDGRGYYRDLCFKVKAVVGGEVVEIGDGGFTDWTAKLTANAKERLLISGLSTDRLATIHRTAG